MEHNHLSFWGRTLQEYIGMFNLDISSTQKILSVGDGPATFNKEGRESGMLITSVDPVYGLSSEEIKAYFEKSYEYNKELFLSNVSAFVFEDTAKINALLNKRRATFNVFIDDFERFPEKYMFGKLPSIPLPDKSFDLCLCSNFLFIFGHLFDLAFHIASISEMLRLANEVRIFPIYDIDGKESPFLNPIINHFSQTHMVSIVNVTYEVYKGGNKMLQICGK